MVIGGGGGRGKTKPGLIRDWDGPAVAWWLHTLMQAATERTRLLTRCGQELGQIVTTDGLRMYLSDGKILHLRISGNAPELRVYVEAADQPSAEAFLQPVLGLLQEKILRCKSVTILCDNSHRNCRKFHLVLPVGKMFEW